MTAWTDNLRMTPWDTETTGVDVENDLIVQASLAWIDPSKGRAGLSRKSWILDHGVDIPEGAAAVHGITRERCAAEGVDPAEALDVLAGNLADSAGLGWPLVGMKVQFDFTMLDRGCRRLGAPTLSDRLDGAIAPVIDVMVLDKYLDPFRPGKRTLTALCARYSVSIEDAHDATGDALAAGRVAWRMAQLAQRPADWLMKVFGFKPDVARRFAELGGLSLTELHELQVTANADQTRSHRAYRARQGAPFDGREEWPLIPYTRSEALA
ncbi:exonuclease domain-containing protein [Nonomuraea sp. NPDC050328]|uniref:exonuclease domain-containing protein n=1 Tax=Nonomuraea sp. NPDC050328 TaxID=3364361 RepID=UPI003792D820